MFKKIGLGLAGLLVVLMVVLFFGPRLINWKWFAPEITAAVKEATGKDLSLNGELDLALLPSLTFHITDVVLEDPKSQTEQPLARIAAISGEMDVLALLADELQIESFVISEPRFTLQIDESGRPNWALEGTEQSGEAAPAQVEEKTESGEEGFPFSQMLLQDIRIEKGGLHFSDLRSGRQDRIENLNLEVALPDMGSPLALTGGAAVNGQDLVLSGDVTTLAQLLGGQDSKVALSLKGDPLALTLNSDVRTQPALGLKGQLALDIPSVGALAAWLQSPLDEDPGPLNMSVDFSSGAESSEIAMAKIAAADLNAELTAKVDHSGDVPKVTLDLKGDTLDLTRYLPAPGESTTPATSTPSEAPGTDNLAQEEKALDQALDSPIDLAGLKAVNLDAAVRIETIKTHQVVAGPIDMKAVIQDGALTADINELGLFDGQIESHAKLAAPDDKVELSLTGKLVDLPLGKIMAGLQPEGSARPLPLAGIANGSLDVSSQGATPRDLIRAVLMQLDVSLAPEASDPPEALVNDAKLSLTRAEANGPAQVQGAVTFRGQQIELTALGTPEGAIEEGGGTFTAQVSSALASLNLDAKREPGPDNPVDADITFKTSGLQAMAAWLGGSAGTGRTGDPVDLSLNLNGRPDKIAIKDLKVTSNVIALAGEGELDNTGAVPNVTVTLQSDQLDLDTLLAALREGEGAADTSEQTGAAEASEATDEPAAEEPETAETAPEDGPVAEDVFAFLPDEPLDLSPLKAANGVVDLTLVKVLYSDLEIGPVAVKGALQDGKLSVDLTEFRVEAANLQAKLNAEAGDEGLKAQSRVDLVSGKGTLVEEKTQGRIDIAEGVTGHLDLTTAGASVRSLVLQLTGDGELAVPGVTLTGSDVAGLKDGKIRFDLPGVTDPPEVGVTATLLVGERHVELPLDLKLKTGPLPDMARGREAPVDLTADLGQTHVNLNGKISGLTTVPVFNFDLLIDAPSTEAYRVFVKELPILEPVQAKAVIKSEGEILTVDGLTAQVGPSDMVGEVRLDYGSRPMDLKASITSKLLDLHSLESPQDGKEDAKAEPAQQEQVTEPSNKASDETSHGTQGQTESASKDYLLKDDPLPLDALAALNADVKVVADSFKVSENLTLSKVDIGILLKDKVLNVDPLKLNMNNGDMDGVVKVDATQEPAQMSLAIEVDSFDMVVSEQVHMTLDGYTDFKASGNSPRQLGSTLTGRTDWVSRKGTVDSGFLGLLTFGTGDILGPLFGGKSNAAFNCLVGRIDFETGIGTPTVFMLDSQDLIVAGDGTIDLRDETLNMSVGTATRSISLADLAVPFLVVGPIASPTVIPDPVGGVGKLSSKALELVNPINAVDMVFGADILGSKKTPCETAFEKIADTKAPADLVVTDAQKEKSKGLVGGAMESIGEGLGSLFGGGSDKEKAEE